MPAQNFISHLTWIAPVILQVLVFVVMIRRRLHREFPWFLYYTGFEAVLGLVTLAVKWLPSFSYSFYFWTTWSGKAVEEALSFAVIYEVFSHVFRSYDGLQKLGKLLLRWSTVILLMLATVSAASAQGSDASRVISGILNLERSVSVVQCGLLFFLFLFSSYFGLSWRHYVFGIALGFGIYGTVELAGFSLRNHFGPSFDATFNLVLPMAYNCAVLIWVSYFLAPAPKHRAVQMAPDHDLDEWNHELMRLLQR